MEVLAVRRTKGLLCHSEEAALVQPKEPHRERADDEESLLGFAIPNAEEGFFGPKPLGPQNDTYTRFIGISRIDKRTFSPG